MDGRRIAALRVHRNKLNGESVEAAQPARAE
jgi:hypothetical protein